MVNLMTGELPVNEGTITFGGRDITALDAGARTHLGMARSFQMLRLFRSLSVEDNLVMACHFRMKSGMVANILRSPASREEERELRARARELLGWFELGDFADRPVSAMSIGQQRMVELARGILAQPKLFVLDEPAAGLSPVNVDRLITLIRRMRDEFGMSILLVEHDMRVVRELCDHVTVLDTGRVIANGEPLEVVNSPAVVEAYIGTGWKRRAEA